MKRRLKRAYTESGERLQWERESGIPEMTPGDRLKVGLEMSDFCLYLEAVGKQNLQRASALYRKQDPSMRRIWEDEAAKAGHTEPFRRCVRLP
jgi:hypothetical protein